MRVVPMRRPGEVDEVAYAILFLASDESSYITGPEIHVEGEFRNIGPRRRIGSSALATPSTALDPPPRKESSGVS